MQLDIITADKTLFSGDIEMVTLPGTDGTFQILKGHAALVSSLIKGQVVVKGTENGNQSFDITGGIVEILNNKVVVLA
jgi:F-type H+-transporting ATPase subunit epsilon